MYMYDLIDVKEYTDTEFDQDQGSPHYFNCPDGECGSLMKLLKNSGHLLIGTKMEFYLTKNYFSAFCENFKSKEDSKV